MIVMKRKFIVNDFNFIELENDEDELLDCVLVKGDERDVQFYLEVLFCVLFLFLLLFGGLFFFFLFFGGFVVFFFFLGLLKVFSMNDVNLKKKLVCLFWQEVKNLFFINGVNKIIWGSIDIVDIDIKKLEYLFENKIVLKVKVGCI